MLHENGNLPAQEMILRQCIMVAMEKKILYNGNKINKGRTYQMIRVTYIFHSGFCVETKDSYYIFDYYKGELPALDRKKPVYVFASHFHQDHYNPEIFELLKKQGFLPGDMKAVLAADIRKKQYPKEIEVLRVSGNKTYSLQDGTVVETLHSTDSGVAYLLTAKDCVIYHAGDLHDWRWEEESEELNHDMTARYRREIDGIAGRKVDVAFLPLDVRQEKDYAEGMLYFLEKVRTRCVYPMHYWEHPEVIGRFVREYPQYRDIVRDTEKAHGDLV